MNQFFAAGAALIVFGSLWLLGKKPKSLDSQSFSNAPFLAPRSLFLKKNFPSASSQSFHKEVGNNWHPPSTPKERVDLRKKINALIKLGPEERMQAIDIASKWRDESVLPVLRIGLRDYDTQIVCAAANGIDKFRCFLKPAKLNQTDRPPLNVFLMR